MKKVNSELKVVASKELQEEVKNELEQGDNPDDQKSVAEIIEEVRVQKLRSGRH